MAWQFWLFQDCEHQKDILKIYEKYSQHIPKVSNIVQACAFNSLSFGV